MLKHSPKKEKKELVAKENLLKAADMSHMSKSYISQVYETSEPESDGIVFR